MTHKKGTARAAAARGARYVTPSSIIVWIPGPSHRVGLKSFSGMALRIFMRPSGFRVRQAQLIENRSLMRLSLALMGLLLIAPAVQAQTEVAPPVAPDSVARRLLADVRSGDSTILVEVRYATANNFTGAPLPGYLGNRAFLRKEAAAALGRVQQRLRSGGMGLKVFDGYRPVRATQGMVEWARRTGQMHLIQ